MSSEDVSADLVAKMTSAMDRIAAILERAEKVSETLETTTLAALSVTQAAEFLGVDRRTLTRSLDDGEIPSVRIGNRRLIPTDGLRRFLAGQAGGES